MKKFDDPCFYCDKYDPKKKCGKYNLLFWNFFICGHKWKKLLHTILTIVRFSFSIAIIISIIAAIVYTIHRFDEKRSTEKHDYLEIAHILVDGDESLIDLNNIKFIERAGFEIDKIIVYGYDHFIFEVKRKNVRYLWIIRGSNETVFPLIENEN